MSTVQIIKELLNETFAEFDRSTPVKTITAMLNLGALQMYQQHFLQKVQRNIYQSGKSSLK